MVNVQLAHTEKQIDRVVADEALACLPIQQALLESLTGLGIEFS